VRPYGRYHAAWFHREEYIREIFHKIACRVEPADPVMPHGIAVKAGKRTFSKNHRLGWHTDAIMLHGSAMKAQNKKFSQNCLPGRTYGRHYAAWYRHKSI
jgi:hypothetical protein